MLTKPQRKILILSSLGGVLEFYDFVIYGLFAAYISKLFFPSSDEAVSLIGTFATFSIGYLMRPIGGIIFGHFGDKYGRKKTFTVSILMMTIATFCVGLIPSYASIGISAPIILTIFRIFQGLSVGGEIPGAIAYVSEALPEKKGFACGVIFFALLCGIVLGSLMHAILNEILSKEAMLSWGWRLPFFIGGLFGLFSYLLRFKLEESKIFRAVEDQAEKFPIVTVFKKKFVNALAAVFVVGLISSVITLLFLFTPAYFTNILHIETQEYSWYMTYAIFLAAILCILFGTLTDFFSHKTLLLILSFLTIIIVYPIFLIYTNYFSYYILAFLLSALLTGFACGSVPSLLVELFPTNIRYSGVAISYNLGFAIFAGLTPLIAIILVERTGMSIAPVFYLIFTALLTLLALSLLKKDTLK